MFKRYPHTATIISHSETEPTDGISGETSSTLSIKGRFEPAALGQSGDLNYKGKFYTPTMSAQAFENDGAKLSYGGRTFTIAMAHNYQSHCEIWLT